MNLPLPDQLGRLLERALGVVEALPGNADEKTRLYHFMAFFLVGIPTMLLFGIHNLWTGSLLLGAVVLAMALSVLVAWLLLPRLKSGIWMYRLNTLFFGGMLLYMLALGGEEGSKSLWLYTFPPVAFFLLGSVEGLAWTTALAIGATGIFWFPPAGWPVHAYGGQFTSRFGVSFLIVSLLAYWFEYLRQHYREGMEAEHRRLLAEQAALQEALSKVKQLSGMLPICASCKKVRDDRGYWRQLEVYIRDHSEAEFSHGLCPDCGERLYPGLPRSGAGSR